jgi:hypothetical protein
MIPKQLLQKGFRFIKVNEDKSPLEKEWTTKNNYTHDSGELQAFIDKYKRYGVVTGYNGLVVIDFDSEAVQEDVLQKLPKTFSVKTAGKGLLHLYYIVKNPKSFKILNLNKDTLADIQGEGKQVIGPNTQMNNREYQVVNNVPIAKTTMSVIENRLKHWIELSKVRENIGPDPDKECQLIKERILLPELLSNHGVDISRNPTSCPFHSSKGGRCFSFNDNVWHCFHCEESGNIFHFLMKIRNISFPEAKEELKIMAKVDYKASTEPESGITYKFLPDILNNPIPEPKWQVEDFVPQGGITYIGAPPGEGKTMLCLYMAECISAGKQFLGKKVMPGKVIYFDAENGEICLYNRLKLIAEGHDFIDEDLENMAVSVFPRIRFSLSDASYHDFNDFCETFQPDVIIFDSLVRFMEGSENDAETCKAVFDFLRSWLKKNPHITIVILHHLSKHNEGGMNALRGSSEISASASSIVMLRRLQHAYKLKIEKSRYVDMSQGCDLYYTLKETENGLFFDTTEEREQLSDAVSMAENDFWKWVNLHEIDTFCTKSLRDYLLSHGHSKNTVFRLIGKLIEERYIGKLKRGYYQIKNKVVSSEEGVK